jgi:predicted permease
LRYPILVGPPSTLETLRSTAGLTAPIALVLIGAILSTARRQRRYFGISSALAMMLILAPWIALIVLHL